MWTTSTKRMPGCGEKKLTCEHHKTCSDEIVTKHLRSLTLQVGPDQWPNDVHGNIEL
ncbi:hypothetical protein L798_07411 [Zootermopsis nevadensis]|uniref:Uncharacterized protein n=1 Tax=Zootermopsis nevadensis TaxID=136037 RepID=A0A067RF42_ZOONE|nr:hypothetical protein L798_07411 [Zootermopsis nevadensis]